MFNTNYYKTGDFNSTLNVNAVSGTLVKHYKDSFFVGFHLHSDFANNILNEKGPYILKNREELSAVILQCMVCGDMEVICEIMWKEDFDKIFKEGKENE